MTAPIESYGGGDAVTDKLQDMTLAVFCAPREKSLCSERALQLMPHGQASDSHAVHLDRNRSPHIGVRDVVAPNFVWLEANSSMEEPKYPPLRHTLIC